MRSIEFHPEAQNEFASAARFYEDQQRGLGLDFTLTIQRTYERLLEFPAAGPYGLLYRVEPDRIYIIAVMHLHRRPGYWRSRL